MCKWYAFYGIYKCRSKVVSITLSYTGISSLNRHLFLCCRSFRRWRVVHLSCGIGDFLEWSTNDIVFPQPMLSSLLCHGVFNNGLAGMILEEASDESWIPQLTCNTQILAAAHQCVGFAPFRSRRYSFGVKVLLFTSGE